MLIVYLQKNWNPEPILYTICAFANDIDNWGEDYIIIDIEEENGMPKLPIKGLEKSTIDRINKELLQKCNLIEPRYIPIVEQIVYEGKELFMLANNQPYDDRPNPIATIDDLKSSLILRISVFCKQ